MILHFPKKKSESKNEIIISAFPVHFYFFFIFITIILNLSLLYGVKATLLSSFILFLLSSIFYQIFVGLLVFNFHLTGSSLVIGASDGLHYCISSLPSKPTLVSFSIFASHFEDMTFLSPTLKMVWGNLDQGPSPKFWLTVSPLFYCSP